MECDSDVIRLDKYDKIAILQKWMDLIYPVLQAIFCHSTGRQHVQ